MNEKGTEASRTPIKIVPVSRIRFSVSIGDAAARGVEVSKKAAATTNPILPPQSTCVLIGILDIRHGIDRLMAGGLLLQLAPGELHVELFHGIGGLACGGLFVEFLGVVQAAFAEQQNEPVGVL